MSEQRPIVPPTVQQEVEEELSFHLEMRVRQLVDEGMSERQARAEALRRFGDLAGVGAECRRLGTGRDRERRRLELLGELRQDVRFALRQLRRAPGFAIVAVLTLALGIGATTAVWSVVRAVLLQPLPFAAADRLVVPQSRNRAGETWTIAYGDFEDWQRAKVFDAVAAYQVIAANLDAPGGTPERVQLALVTPGLLETLRVAPLLGRDFRSDEFVRGGPRRCLVSYELWQRRFGGRRDVIGREIHVGGRAVEVVGVLPHGLGFPREVEVWSPLRLGPEDMPDMERRDNYIFESVARLAGGKTLTATRAELAGLAARVSRDLPAIRADVTVTALPLDTAIVGPTLPRALWLLLGAVALVLGIGCVNVANLLLARAATRRSELAVRASLGAGRRRLVRQLLTESLVLGGVGGVLGVLLAWGATRGLLRLAPADIPRLDQVHVQAPVLLFAIGVALLATLAFGAGPALRLSADGSAPVLRASSSRALTARTALRRRLLVAVEVALALVLFVGSMLVLRSLRELLHTDPGFRTGDLLTFSLSLQGDRYQDDAVRVATLEELRKQLEAVPGVERAAMVSSLPLGGGGFYLGRSFLPAGRAEPPAGKDVQGQWSTVTAGSFATLGVPLLAGRDFDGRDGAGSPPVMIVNREMALRTFGRVDVLGERVRSWRDENVYREIVGVVDDVRYFGAGDEIRPLVYVPAAQDTWASWVAMVRTRSDPRLVVPQLRTAVARVDPQLPLARLQTMEEVFDASIAPRRFGALLLAGFAGLAVMLALVGIYSVLSYEVAQRRREIGIRMALGSRRRDVLRMVVTEATALVLAGVAAGIVVSMLLSRFVAPLLYETRATDPLTYVVAGAVLATVALAAAWMPARRAAAGDPMVTMRVD